MRKLIAYHCCDQLTAVKTGYNLTVPRLKCRPIEVEYFLKLSADKIPVSNDRWLKFIFPMIHSGALWVRKCGKLPIRENLAIT